MYQVFSFPKALPIALKNTGSSSTQSKNCMTYLYSIYVWHKRLAHASLPIVRKDPKSCDIQFHDNNTYVSICVACQMGKFYKMSFSQSKTIITQPFELVHSDL